MQSPLSLSLSYTHKRWAVVELHAKQQPTWSSSPLQRDARLKLAGLRSLMPLFGADVEIAHPTIPYCSSAGGQNFSVGASARKMQKFARACILLLCPSVRGEEGIVLQFCALHTARSTVHVFCPLLRCHSFDAAATAFLLSLSDSSSPILHHASN